MTRAILRAHAKINLYLKILGRRPDGYHGIESVVQTVSLHDSLEFEAADRFELEVDPPALPANRDNLVWKAAEALLEGRPARGARIVLRKRIP
ncbi:MAG TPA: 4-(cytidine 5'-diphospho)-2-C-methyl-D-erythritol kinase, partial [Candidatus Polarisedimenticolia bacterium]